MYLFKRRRRLVIARTKSGNKLVWRRPVNASVSEYTKTMSNFKATAGYMLTIDCDRHRLVVTSSDIDTFEVW